MTPLLLRRHMDCLLNGHNNAKAGIDIEVVRKVWEQVGSRAQLIVDPNRGMTASQALRLSLACSNIPFVFEQPCYTMDEMISIRPQIAHPIIIDENLENLSEVLRAISMRVCDGFGLKLTRMGDLNAMSMIRVSASWFRLTLKHANA